jgi:Protein of unknown function (DUF3108)
MTQARHTVFDIVVTRPARSLALTLCCVVATVIASWPSTSRADPGTALQPYIARYQVSYRGLSGGEIESTFRRGSHPGLWQYESRVFPNFFGRIAVSPQARELSSMQVAANGVRPLSFSFNDGASDKQKDVRLAYDWAGGKLTGTAEGKTVAIDLVPGVQDTASVQAAMIQERLAGRKPQSFKIVTGGKLREYRYWMEGTQQVMTPFGQVEAEVWANARDGSNRVSKVWHAPSLGYVPVQAIQYRKGNPEVQMKLVRLQRPE